MLKVYHLLGLAEPKRGDVGLELEVEGLAQLPHIEEKSWRTKRDNSLRGFGNEYYSKQPIKVDDRLFERIKYLSDKLRQPQHQVQENCYRTSFHVHCNVTDFTIKQAWTAATTYWLVENLLAEYSGDDRKGNLFCLRLSDAESAIDYVLKDIRASTPFQHIGNDRIRYMGQNLCALPLFGSLEYRTMRGTLDPQTLCTWTTQLHKMVKQPLWQSPKELLDFYYRDGPGAVLAVLFDLEFWQTLTRYPGWEDMVEENAGALCEIAYAVDWDKWEERINKANEHYWKEPTVKAVKLPPNDFWVGDRERIPPGARVGGFRIDPRQGLQFQVIPDEGNDWNVEAHR
jgi:hypothetical protein